MKYTEHERMMKRLYSRMKAKAKHRSKKWDIEIGDFEPLVMDRCGYCGSPPSNQLKYNGLKLAYNGLDRLDSSKGYSVANVVPCCSFCNSVKGSMKWETWASWINDVVGYHGGQEPFEGEDADRSSKSFYRGR